MFYNWMKFITLLKQTIDEFNEHFEVELYPIEVKPIPTDPTSNEYRFTINQPYRIKPRR